MKMKSDIAVVSKRLIIVIVVLAGGLLLAGCETLKEVLKPTTIERVEYEPTAKPEWEGQTVYIDFDNNYSLWSNSYMSGLSESIRDQLIEAVIEDQIFKVQDKRTTGTEYLYRIEVRISNPVISTSSSGVIQSISASFRIKTYDSSDNLVIAKTREVRYDSPAFTVSTGNSQRQLVDDFAYNAFQEIRQIMYESLK